MVKRDIVYVSLISLLLVIAIFSAKESLNKNEIIDDIKLDNDSLKNEIKILIDSAKISKNLKDDEFKLAYKRFLVYNKHIKKSTVKKFLEVMGTFELDSTSRLFDICVSQICVESGAKQNINGILLESSGNAIGITQIVPTTAHHYLRNVLNKKDVELFKKLGASSFNFIQNQPKYSMNQNERNEVKSWLANETNNIILWGYIMRHNLDKTNFNIPSTLVAYNQGGSFLNEYLKAGLNAKNHIYVVTIEDTIRKLKTVS